MYYDERFFEISAFFFIEAVNAIIKNRKITLGRDRVIQIVLCIIFNNVHNTKIRNMETRLAVLQSGLNDKR